MVDGKSMRVGLLLGWLLLLAGVWGEAARLEGQGAEAAQAVPELMARTGCTQCHGATLAGTEKAPRLVGIGSRLKEMQIRTQIHDGGAAMPAFGDVLSPDELTAIAHYLATSKSAPHR